MKFFIPHAKDDKQAMDVYESTKKFIKQQLGWDISERMIKGISYIHDGKNFIAEVGKIESRTGDEVITILESTTFLVCTACKGVLGGEPIMVGKSEITHIEDFK